MSHETRVEDAYNDKKVKTLIDSNFQNSKSIKSLAIKKNNCVKVTTRFGNEKC